MAWDGAPSHRLGREVESLCPIERGLSKTVSGRAFEKHDAVRRSSLGGDLAAQADVASDRVLAGPLRKQRHQRDPIGELRPVGPQDQRGGFGGYHLDAILCVRLRRREERDEQNGPGLHANPAKLDTRTRDTSRLGAPVSLGSKIRWLSAGKRTSSRRRCGRWPIEGSVIERVAMRVVHSPGCCLVGDEAGSETSASAAPPRPPPQA